MTLLDLDIRTTMRLLVIGNLIAAIVLMAYKHQCGRKLPMLMFLLSKFFQAIGWYLLSLRGEINILLSANLANLLLLVGFALEMAAFSRLTKVRPKFEMALVGFVAVGSIPLWIFPDRSLWVAIVSSAVVSIYAPTAVIMFRQANASRLQRVISVFFLIFSTVMTIRVYSALVDGIGLFSMTIIQSLTFISLFGFSLVGGIGFLLLKNEQLEQDLLVAATTDPLTGILNRRAFFNNAELALNIAVRNRTTMTFLMIDIDHFKKINDTYGHAVGDAVLQAFANNVRQQIRPHDVFGRIGGEEFGVLVFGSEADPAVIAERIRTSTEQQVVDLAGGVRYTTSIGGYTCVPKSIADLEILQQRSDVALYQAKNNGRNQVQLLT